LFSGAIAYTVLQIRNSRRESAAVREEFDGNDPPSSSSLGANLAWLAMGLVGLVLGSKWLVDSSVAFAAALGVSELVIGLTIVSVGTSLPEVATSVVAALRGERDIAVGNVIGSCVFNLLSVLGVAAAVAPAGIPVDAALLSFDLPVMIAVAVACLPIFATGATIQRWEGLLFLLYSVAYVTYVVLAAQEHEALPTFSAAMQWFVLPITVLTFGIVSWRARHDPNHRWLAGG
jgi:cation:H+ antiporter